MNSYTNLIKFSLPSTFSILLIPLAGLVDTAFLGNLKTDWLSSLAISMTLINAFTWVFNFLLHVSTTSVASFNNNKEKHKIIDTIKITFILSLVLSLIFYLLLFFFRDLIFDFMQVDESLRAQAWEYLRVRMAGHFFVLYTSSLTGIIRGLKEVKSVLVIGLMISLINIGLNYYFLFMLETGIAGAAYGTAISFAIGALVSFVYLLKVLKIRCREVVTLKRIMPNLWSDFGRDSFNIFFRSLSLTTTFFLATTIASSIGVKTLGLYQIMIECWLFVAYIIDGFAVSASILVPYSQDKETYRVLLKRLNIISLGIGSFLAIIFLIFDQEIISLFTKDPVILEESSKYWIYLALSQPLNSLAFILDGINMGLKDFAFLRRHMILGFVVFIIPLYYLSYETSNLLLVFIAMIGLNIYRCLSGIFNAYKPHFV